MPTTPILTHAPTAAAPGQGRVVGDRYRLIEPLGLGGMGEVWRAARIDGGAELAVKILRADHAEAEGAATRFEREAQAAGRLAHPGCVAVLDFGRDPLGLYLVMELVHGRSLGARLTEGRLPLAEAARVIDGVLAALQHAHALGVVHRDLKPENVMLVPAARTDEPDTVKLLDFGVARLVDLAVDPSVRHATAAGLVVGTPQYLSPEQALGEPGDARSDLYAIGVVLHELLTGKQPFTGATQREVLAAHISRTPPAPSEVAPDAGIPPAIDAVVARALAKSASERYPSAAEFRRELQQACAQAGVLLPRSASASSTSAEGEGVPWTSPGLASVTRAPPGPGLVSVLRDRFLGLPGWQRGLGAAVALVLVVTLVSLVIAALTGGAPAARAPQAVRSAEPGELAQVRDALARGDHAAARGAAERLVTANPDDPRAFVLLGHTLFTSRDKLRGLAAYREAVRLDRFAADSELLANLRATFDNKAHGEDAFVIAERIGARAGRVLLDFAGATREPRLRARAHRAITTIGERASSGDAP